jgi:DNA-binding response OmpR family regulator
MNGSLGRRPLRALLVDDDEGTCAAHTRHLVADGYEVARARDWESGLTLARNARPEIIFLHLVRGGSPALAFLQKLRADDTLRHIPVSMLAAPGSGRLKWQGLNAVSGEGW